MARRTCPAPLDRVRSGIRPRATGPRTSTLRPALQRGAHHPGRGDALGERPSGPGLLTRVAKGLREHHGGALPRREGAEGPGRHVPILDGLEDVLLRPEPHRPADGHPGSPILVPKHVHRSAVEVAGRIRHRRHRVPALEHPGEGLLGEVLCLGPAPGDDRQDPKEAFLLFLEEPLERRRLCVHRVIGSRRRPPKISHLTHPDQSTPAGPRTCRGQEDRHGGSPTWTGQRHPPPLLRRGAGTSRRAARRVSSISGSHCQRSAGAGVKDVRYPVDVPQAHPCRAVRSGVDRAPPRCPHRRLGIRDMKRAPASTSRWMRSSTEMLGAFRSDAVGFERSVTVMSGPAR